MGKISIYKVVSDVKEKYIEATGESDNIKFGEIAQDIYDAITSGGGGNIGYKVTFKVNGNDYYVASCQQGESITEPPIPTSETGNFDSWQLNGVDIAFPYTPNADVELTARFSTVRTEMEVTIAGTPLAEQGGTTMKKWYDGKAIFGYSWNPAYPRSYEVLISSAEMSDNPANAVKNTYNNTAGTIVYDGTTYNYGYYQSSVQWNILFSGGANVGTLTNITDVVTAILDHYFNKD